MRMKKIHQPQGKRIRIGQELKNCGIESTPVKRNMKRIDDFWEKVRKKDVKNIHNLLPK